MDTSNLPLSIQNLSLDKTPHKTKMQAQKKDVNGDKRDQLMADRDAYLQLLIAQLKNQNPNNPADTQQMTQQIVAISQAEQAITANEHLEKLVNLYQASHRSNAINYIGKEVEYDNSHQIFTGGSVPFTYSIDEPADRMQIKIKNSSGEIVRVIGTSLEQKTQGIHNFVWDGHTDSGRIAKQGKYKIEIDAHDINNAPIHSSTGIKSLVTGVYEETGNLRLKLANKNIIDVDQVSSIGINTDTKELQDQVTN